MRIACVLAPNLAVQLELNRDPSLRGRPAVIGGDPFESKPVIDASPEAVAVGVAPGMPLRQAHSLCPEAVFLPANTAACEAALEKLIAILDSFSPSIEPEKPESAYLDFTGVGNEKELARRLLSEVSSRTGLQARAGISSGKFFARVAAIGGTACRATTPIMTIQAGGERDFVAPISVGLLPCQAETIERLHRLGVRTIGRLAHFPADALVAQFGVEGRLMHELASGIDRAPLVPLTKADAVVETAECRPTGSYLEILQLCRSTLDRLLEQVKEQCKVCAEISIQLGFESGDTREKRLCFKEATCSPDTILDRLKTFLEISKLPSPVTGVRLSLLLKPETGKNLSLWPGRLKAGHELEKLTAGIQARFGYQPLKKVQVVDAGAILPERRFRLKEVS